MKDTVYPGIVGEGIMALESEPPEDEVMEPLDFSTKRNSPPAWGHSATPITPESHPHSTFTFNSPSYSDGSSSSPPLVAATNPALHRAGEPSYYYAIHSPLSYVPDGKPSLASPHFRTSSTPSMDVSSSIEPSPVRMLTDPSLVIQNRCKEPTKRKSRSPMQVEKKLSVKSPSRLNSKSFPEANSTCMDSSFTETLPGSSPPGSYIPFVTSQVVKPSRRDSLSSDDSSDLNSNNNYKNTRIYEENMALNNPLLMAGVNSNLNMHPIPLHPSLLHLQQTNPVFLSALYGILSQQKAAQTQPPATSLLPLTAQPLNPQIPQIPLVTPPLPVPTAIPSLLPVTANPYSLEQDEEPPNASYLQFRAALKKSGQIGQRQRKAPVSRSSQNPKEKTAEATDTPMKEDTNADEDDKKAKASNSKDTTVKDQAYWERRKKNNEAAKRSRDARRAKEDEVAVRAAFLENENMQLRMQLQLIKKNLRSLQAMHYFPKEPSTPALPGY